MNETPSLRDLIARAVEEKGADYVYPGSQTGDCTYFEGGRPSCLIGYVLSYLGESGTEYEGLTADAALQNYPFSEAELEAARTAQAAQDSGDPWGLALADFDRTIENAKARA